MLKEQRICTDDGRLGTHREKPSRRLSKAVVEDKPTIVPGMPPFYEWENDLYFGSLRRYDTGAPLGWGGAYACIGIYARANDARHDWREYQQIKNDLVGPEWEAVELYPAESRLVDPSNAFYLWCFPPGVLKDLGLPIPGRRVVGPQDKGPPQRPFPEEDTK